MNAPFPPTPCWPWRMTMETMEDERIGTSSDIQDATGAFEGKRIIHTVDIQQPK